MKIGYVRVSTVEQNEIRQEVLMKELGVERIYIDKASGRNMKRPQLEEMMNFMREGDVIVVESISRLSRSIRDFLYLLDKFQQEGVRLVSQKEQLDTFFKPEREKSKAYRERKKAEKEQERQEIEEKLNYYQGLVERLTKLTKELYPKKEYPKEIVIDTETTGLDMFEDELLQVSIIDTDGNVVFDSYFKPIRHSEWYEAQAVNDISPAMVADAPSIYL